jgi:hypothetical protein
VILSKGFMGASAPKLCNVGCKSSAIKELRDLDRECGEKFMWDVTIRVIYCQENYVGIVGRFVTKAVRMSVRIRGRRRAILLQERWWPRPLLRIVDVVAR